MHILLLFVNYILIMQNQFYLNLLFYLLQFIFLLIRELIFKSFTGVVTTPHQNIIDLAEEVSLFNKITKTYKDITEEDQGNTNFYS